MYRGQITLLAIFLYKRKSSGFKYATFKNVFSNQKMDQKIVVVDDR